MTAPSHSFTTAFQGGISNVLTNECGISFAFDPASGEPHPQAHPFKAIWDTGATNSVISQAVIDKCELVATGTTQVNHAHGIAETGTYLVSIFLPNGVVFPGLRVTRGIPSGADILIGMDIMNQGDFAVTNHSGITKFSFRMPSQEHIDFVAQSRKDKLMVSFQHGGKKSTKPKQPKTFGKKKRK